MTVFLDLDYLKTKLYSLTVDGVFSSPGSASDLLSIVSNGTHKDQPI